MMTGMPHPRVEATAPSFVEAGRVFCDSADRLGKMIIKSAEAATVTPVDIGDYDISRLLSRRSNTDEDPLVSVTAHQFFDDVYNPNKNKQWTSVLMHPVESETSIIDAFRSYTETPSKAQAAIERSIRYMRGRISRESKTLGQSSSTPSTKIVEDVLSILGTEDTIGEMYSAARELRTAHGIEDPTFDDAFIDHVRGIVAIGLELNLISNIGTRLEDIIADTEPSPLAQRNFFHLANSLGDVLIDPLEPAVTYQLAFNQYINDQS